MSLVVDPVIAYLAAVGLFVIVARSPSLHTRAGGGVLAAGLVTGLAGLALDPLLGPRLVEPQRLPAAVFAVAAMVVSWWALRRETLRRRDGVLRPPRVGRRTDAVAMVGVVAVVALAVVWPVPISSLDAMPWPWFLMGLAELTRVVPPAVAFGWLPAIVVVALITAPWLDTRDPDDLEARRDEVPFFLFAWAALGWAPMLAAVVWRRQPVELAPSLSARLWEGWLAVPTPSWLLLRELPGLLLVGLLFVVLPWWLPRWRASRGVFERHRRRLGWARYYAVMTLGVVVASVPLKMVIAFVVGVGPWIDLPEWGVVL